MQPITLPFEGLLTTQGFRFPVPTAGGATFYGFFLEVLDTRTRANEYVILRRPPDTGWRQYTFSAFSTGITPYDLIEPQEFSFGWAEYAMVPTNMGSFGRIVRIGSFTF